LVFDPVRDRAEIGARLRHCESVANAAQGSRAMKNQIKRRSS
jgi:hypothetical protein